jgi:hypothetical protein
MSRYDEEVRAHISPGSESILPSETRRGRDALAPCACVTPGVNSSMKSNGMADESPAGWWGASRRCVFPACPGVPSLVQGIRMPHLYRVVFGKPLHSFSRFGLQDAQTPPSPRVDEGGRGDERANTPNLPLRPVWEKGGGGMRGQTRPTSPFAPCGRRGAGGCSQR